MLDAGSDGCSRSLVPSVGGWLTDLSAAGAVISTAVTVPRFFFFFTLVVWFPTTIPIEKYYPTFHRGLTVSAWASCRDWVAYSNFRCWLHVMKCEFNVIIFHSWMASLALYQRLTAPASLNQVTCKYWPSLEMKVLILHHMLSVIQVLSLNASSLSGYNKQNPDKPLHTVHRYTTRWGKLLYFRIWFSNRLHTKLLSARFWVEFEPAPAPALHRDELRGNENT